MEQAIQTKERLWKNNEDCSSEFLTKHHDLVLYDTFHHILSFLLFPLHCKCKDTCLCNERREEIILSLNAELYNKARKENKNSKHLRVMKFLLNIPDAETFLENHGKAYPLWLIEKELQKRMEGKSFKMVGQFVTVFLKLAATYKIMLKKPLASLNEATEMILGKLPLNSTVGKNQQMTRLGGQAAYKEQFNIYKSVSHFIAALEVIQGEKGGENIWREGRFSLTLIQIERFLKLSHLFRTKLVCLQTPNVKNKTFLTEETLISLPTWINSDDIDLPIEPYEEKIQEIMSTAVLIDPKTKIARRLVDLEE